MRWQLFDAGPPITSSHLARCMLTHSPFLSFVSRFPFLFKNSTAISQKGAARKEERSKDTLPSIIARQYALPEAKEERSKDTLTLPSIRQYALLTTMPPTKKRKAAEQDEIVEIDDDDSSASSGSPSEDSEEDTPVFPFCEGMDMGSDGSDYDSDDERQDDATVGKDDDVLEYDDTSGDEDPEVLQLFHQAADDTDQWDAFVRHITKHPDDAQQGYLVWGYDRKFGRFLQPTFLHAYLEIMWRGAEEDISAKEEQTRLDVLRAIVKSNPDAMTVQPSALGIALFTTPAAFLASTVAVFLDVCPEAAKLYHQELDSSSRLPLHVLIKRVQDSRNADTTRDCTKVMPTLCKAFPEATLHSSKHGFIARMVGFLAEWGKGRDAAYWNNESPTEFYHTFLREATKVYLGMPQDSDPNEVDRHVLFVAVDLEDQIIKNHGGPQAPCMILEPLCRMVIKSPRLASSQDENGDYPLPHAITKLAPYLDVRVRRTIISPHRFRMTIEEIFDESGAKYVKQLMESNPSALTKPVSFDSGRLPIHLALENSYSAALIDIIDIAPETISIQDPVTKLYPFMMAAVGEEPSLNMIYKLLRPNPVVALGD